VPQLPIAKDVQRMELAANGAVAASVNCDFYNLDHLALRAPIIKPRLNNPIEPRASQIGARASSARSP
jgi:hypothetical protein